MVLLIFNPSGQGAFDIHNLCKIIGLRALGLCVFGTSYFVNDLLRESIVLLSLEDQRVEVSCAARVGHLFLDVCRLRTSPEARYARFANC